MPNGTTVHYLTAARTCRHIHPTHHLHCFQIPHEHSQPSLQASHSTSRSNTRANHRDTGERIIKNLRTSIVKVKVKQGHTPKKRRRGAHLPFIGRWALRWINYYCLWRMASVIPDLRYLPSLSGYSLHLPTEGWPGWVELGGCLRSEIVYPPEVVTHPGTNRAQRRVTMLIETNTLSLS